ncbi:cysteine hydrolase family protein [Actinoplanes awajinensis]|uniref:Isochorismatase n=1 Tax=Actinoplanes awajinensis subsp. mycoplanecinus TaxID=135947 RepID=A0A101JF18_9ACTN|nr:isochorismatase family cysteine hydrolase [Actinoplanes awajinensis]KUL25583.1 isochorismatase [Actinoplanes awajinensis subsp. mycoplanecinus]
MSASALLVMDVQRAVVARYPDPDYLPRLRSTIDAARGAGVPVIYVSVGFRPGGPEISPRNRMFGRLAGAPAHPAAEEGMQVHPDVVPEPGDIVVVKRRVSGFAGSDLEMVLRAGGFDNLVLTGIATSGVVLSTLRQAADLDFGLTVLADGCLDSDAEVHRVLTEKVFPMQADVVTSAEWVAGL